MDIESLPVHLQAWEFLRRNRKYRSAWKRGKQKDRHMPRNLGIPLFRQTPPDLEALQWGLLAYEHPDTDAVNADPFWAIGPMLEADVVEDGGMPFLPMLRRAGARMAGLRLLDDALILAIRKDGVSVQIKLGNGWARNGNWSVLLRLPFDLRLPLLLSRACDLWNIAGGTEVRKTGTGDRRIFANLSLFSTA